MDEYLTGLFANVSTSIEEKIDSKITEIKQNLEDRTSDIPDILVSTLNEVLPTYMQSFQEAIVENLKDQVSNFIPGFSSAKSLSPEENAEMQSKAESSVNEMTIYGIESQLPQAALGILQQIWPTWREDYAKNPALSNTILGVAQQRGLFNILSKFSPNQSPPSVSQGSRPRSSGW